MKKMFILFLFSMAVFIYGQEKYALVIGNSNYTNFGTLRNPINDANDMKDALESLGFKIELILNGSLGQMENAAIRLRNNLSEAGTSSIGLFYYAGHGLEMGGANYLIPADANIPDGFFLRERAFSVQVMLDMLNSSSNALNIVVLDACRDFPAAWSRSLSRGLAIVTSPPANHIIMYATGAGAVAIDGQSRNGLFTSHLINNLTLPFDVNEIFRRTMADVARDSNNEQRPALYTDFSETLFFNQEMANAASSYQPSYQMQPVQPAEPIYIYQPVNDPEAWKNKWLYLGGSLGFGGYTAVRSTATFNNNADDLAIPFEVSAEFAFLPFLSLELNIVILMSNYITPFYPIMLKAGYRFDRVEAFFDIGYAVPPQPGLVLGGTFGVNIGPGVLFARFIALPSGSAYQTSTIELNSVYMGLIGYKFGLINKRK